jgi:putative DNA primase/helicase
LSLWRENGRLTWRWKAVPEPRPLYGLDRLAKRPDASVAICEGEKSADAAARIFPNSVCITSPGGSQAASKADWSPLEGRRVLVWPDADEPGAKYAATVAGNLHGLGCEVSITDAMALASMGPDGGKREPEKGWDAADAITEWPDVGALRKAAVDLATPYVATPTINVAPAAKLRRGLNRSR